MEQVNACIELRTMQAQNRAAYWGGTGEKIGSREVRLGAKAPGKPGAFCVRCGANRVEAPRAKTAAAGSGGLRGSSLSQIVSPRT